MNPLQWLTIRILRLFVDLDAPPKEVIPIRGRLKHEPYNGLGVKMSDEEIRKMFPKHEYPWLPWEKRPGRPRLIYSRPKPKPTCCICDPRLPLNPYVCEAHKEAGKAIAKREGIYYSEAAGMLYLDAISKLQASESIPGLSLHRRFLHRTAQLDS